MRSVMAERGRQQAESFPWRRAAKQVLRLYANTARRSSMPALKAQPSKG